MIFDMDGVLVDGEPLHLAAAQAILAEEGARLDTATYRNYIGRTMKDIWPDLQARFQLRIPRQEYARRYTALVTEQYRRQARLLPGARALLDRVRARRVPCALASSSQRQWVEAALTAMELRDSFRVIVAGDEVSRGKPDPEIYGATAARLGVAPERCLVLEDAPAGIEAARRAGMRVIAVRTPLTADLPLTGAERIIDSLEAFDLRWLDGGERRN